MLRLKVLRKQEERMNKIEKLMNMWPNNSNSYYPIGGSNLTTKLSTVTINPRIQAQKNLFEMFHLAR